MGIAFSTLISHFIMSIVPSSESLTAKVRLLSAKSLSNCFFSCEEKMESFTLHCIRLSLFTMVITLTLATLNHCFISDKTFSLCFILDNFSAGVLLSTEQT